MEIGSPMAKMYPLQNPDHYVSHQFIPFWWKSFVNDVRNYDSNNPALDLKNQEENQKIFKTSKQETDILFENENKMNVDNSNSFFGGGNHINRNIYTDDASDKEIKSDDEYNINSDNDDPNDGKLLISQNDNEYTKNNMILHY